MNTTPDPVGRIEAAMRLGVKLKTVHQWQFRQLMPEPTWPSINGGPAWEWHDLLQWAGETGHIGPGRWAEYERTFGKAALVRRTGKLPPDVQVTAKIKQKPKPRQD